MPCKIKYVKASKSGATYLLGILAEGEDARYKIPSRLYHELGEPLAGAILTDEELSEIKIADEGGRATKKALSLLSYADVSERNMVAKLRRSGYSHASATEAAREMVMHGYSDEHRQLLRLVEREANSNLYGPMRILPKLMQKGYRSDAIKAAMHELCEDGSVDFVQNAARLAEKRLAADATDDDRRALLYKYGYKGR